MLLLYHTILFFTTTKNSSALRRTASYESFLSFSDLLGHALKANTRRSSYPAYKRHNTLQTLLDRFIETSDEARWMHRRKFCHETHMPFLSSFHGMNVFKTLSQAEASRLEQVASRRNVQPLAGVCSIHFIHDLLSLASKRFNSGRLTPDTREGCQGC
jgi:hypothetical protein